MGIDRGLKLVTPSEIWLLSEMMQQNPGYRENQGNSKLHTWCGRENKHTSHYIGYEQERYRLDKT